LRRARTPAAGALLSLALACARTSAPPPPPSPLSVEPATAYAGRDTQVLLHGEEFNPELVQQLSGGSRIALQDGFQAFLGNVELGNVRFIDSGTLSATVPAALTPGDYALAVQGPFGRGTVPDAYHALPPDPASLTAAAAAPAQVLVGQQFAVTAGVSNTGGAAALGVSAGTATSVGPPATLQPPPESEDMDPGATHTFVWQAQASAPGTLDLTLPVAGRDAVDGSVVAASAAASVRVVTPAHLVISPAAAPPSQPAGPSFQISVDVLNDGGSDALGLQFDPLNGAAGIVEVLSAPAPQDVPAGATRTFTWTIHGIAQGTAQLQCDGAAVDSTDGSTVLAPPAQWTVIIFNAVAVLVPTLTVPPGALPNETFSLTLRVDNPGLVDALAVQPSIAVSGTGAVTLLGSPSAANVPAGGSASFVWSYRAASAGPVNFVVTATGTDALSGNPVTATASGSSAVATVAPVATDPFADGTGFAYVFAYANRVWLGPSADGTRSVRMSYDGTSPEAVQYALQTDPAGVKNAVSPLPPAFPSLGYTGCALDTLQCGPDDENGRGLLTSLVLNGKEWLFAAGSRQTSILKHVYLTTDVTASPQLPFLGINPPGGTRGSTAAAAMGSSLYLGLADGGGTGNPVLLKMTGFPADSTQPINPTITNALLPATLHSQGTGLIDSLIVFDARLYAANDGGCVLYDGVTWAVCTPSKTAWSIKTPITTSKTSDFVPADKAVPQMAAFNGWLYMARNTTSGPQIWACNPNGVVCNTFDWSIVPNQSLDPTLTQMDNSALSTISLLVATSQHLYVGYDSASGAQLYRSNTGTPVNTDDFTSVAAAGLNAGLTQILDGQALSTSSKEFLYLVARAGSGPAQVYRAAP
jgi:hypothetical protein